MLFDPSQIEADSTYGNLYGDNSSQFVRDAREKERISQKKSLENAYEASEDLTHRYNELAN